MTHIHAHDPDYACPCDDGNEPEDLAAYRAVEAAGRDDDGCSTEAAFAIFTAHREAWIASGKYPWGKHWNGPEMKPTSPRRTARHGAQPSEPGTRRPGLLGLPLATLCVRSAIAT